MGMLLKFNQFDEMRTHNIDGFMFSVYYETKKNNLNILRIINLRFAESDCCKNENKTQSKHFEFFKTTKNSY